MPPTPATAAAITFELPPAAAELVDGEFEYMTQRGISMPALPVMLMPHLLALACSARTQASPPAGTFAAVDVALMIGAAVMNMELNGSGCCTASVTWTCIFLVVVSAG